MFSVRIFTMGLADNDLFVVLCFWGQLSGLVQNSMMFLAMEFRKHDKKSSQFLSKQLTPNLWNDEAGFAISSPILSP